jgi:5-methylcytosine-specific restriction endonuclease McrA
MPHQIKQRRFCSRRCWGLWHRGENNKQTNRVRLTCDHCGIEFEKIPSHVGKYNYCSKDCSSVAHGDKLRGAKHPNYQGGSLKSRGEEWGATRALVIARQNYKCANCGMSNDEHIQKYYRGLHVHHRELFRLTAENSLETLVALCVSCHSKEDAAIRRGLTEEERKLIEEQTAKIIANKLDHDDGSRSYDLCPQCNNRKAKHATLCRKCPIASRLANRKPHHYCPQCGSEKEYKAKLCFKCHLAKRRG